MHVKQAAFFTFLGLASGYGYNTECGPMDAHMFSALEALSKTPLDLRYPNSLPYPHLPAVTDQIKEIQNVVRLMMENHSWDHVFGLLKRRGNDGFPLDDSGNPMTLVSQRYANGSTQLLYEMPSTCAGATNGPSQNLQTSHQQYNNGSMNGWAIGGNQDKPIAMGYLTKKHLPFFTSLAEKFAINDRFLPLAWVRPGRTGCLRSAHRPGALSQPDSQETSPTLSTPTA